MNKKKKIQGENLDHLFIRILLQDRFMFGFNRKYAYKFSLNCYYKTLPFYWVCTYCKQTATCSINLQINLNKM